MRRPRASTLGALLTAAVVLPAWANSPVDPVGWGATGIATLVAEALAVLGEAWSYRKWLGLPPRTALVASAVANTVSLVAGVVFCCIWTGLLFSGSRFYWLTLIGAFLATLAIETPIVVSIAWSNGVDPGRAARVVLVTHLVSWPLTMVLIYGAVLGTWVLLALSGARG